MMHSDSMPSASCIRIAASSTVAFALALSLLAAPVANAQVRSVAENPAALRAGQVQGTLVNAASGEPVAGAQIAVEGQSVKPARSDTQGWFRLYNLAPGPCTLVVTSPDIQTTRIVDVVVKPDETVTLADIRTPPAFDADKLQQLDEVVINANAIGVGAVGDEVVHLEALTVSTGEWGALQSATEARRQTAILVDVVNPDDIGALPDFNVGETLQRLPGISIDMDEAEARFVTIRGFNANYNTTTINGSLFAVPDRNGRRVFMDVLPASLASSFEVVKMQTPDIEGHSVGGSINIKGPTAMRKKPFTLKIAGKIGWYTNDEGYDGNGPSGTADLLLTRRIGSKMGIAVSANYYKRNSYTPSVEYSATRYTVSDTDPTKLKPYTDADAASGAFAIPGERRWYWRHNNRTRKGGSFKWEWRPARGLDFWALAYYNAATDDESRQTDLLGNWSGATISNVSADTNAGTIGHARNQQYLGQFDFKRSLYGIQIGGDLRLASDSTLNFRATRSGSRFRNPEHWVEWRRGGTRRELAFNYRQDGGLFYFSGTGAAKKPDKYVDNLEEDRVNFNAYNFNRRQFDNRRLDETVHDIQVDFEQQNVAGIKNLSAKAGAKFRRIDRDFDEERDKYTSRGDGIYTLGQADVVNSDLALRPPGALPWQSIVVIDPSRANASWLAEYAANKAGWDAKFDPMTNEDNNLDYTTVEDVVAAYAMLQYKTDRLTVIGGVRMEDTHDKSTGRVFSNDAWGPTQNNGRYRDWLPSAVIAWDLTSRDKLRLGASATIGRPPFNQFAPVGESVSAGTDDDGGSYLSITRSNPDLKPRRSNNVTISFDHYFKKNKGLAAIALHHNRLKNEIFTATSEIEIMWEGELQTASVKQPTNSGRTTVVSAVELILLRHLDFLPGLLSGLKFNGNVTFISSDFRVLMAEKDADGNDVWFRTRTAIGQPKRTVNIALLYDWKRFSAKIAVNHTSLKLTERVNTAQACRNRYETATTRLTANIRYKINKHWRVDLSGWNLTNEGGRNEVIGLRQELPMVTQDIGRAIFLGVTYSY